MRARNKGCAAGNVIMWECVRRIFALVWKNKQSAIGFVDILSFLLNYLLM